MERESFNVEGIEIEVEKTSKDDFEEIYPDVTTTLNKTYRSDF